jgi:hypothetical protein
MAVTLPSEATTVPTTANITPCGPPRRVEKFANLRPKHHGDAGNAGQRRKQVLKLTGVPKNMRIAMMLRNTISENATAPNPEARYCSER